MLIRYIRHFLAVTGHQNCARAVEALHVSLPTHSQPIKQLEEARASLQRSVPASATLPFKFATTTSHCLSN